MYLLFTSKNRRRYSQERALQSLADVWQTRSRLYRRQILQVNTRLKALGEIYKIYIPLHLSDLNKSAIVGRADIKCPSLILLW